MELAKAGLEQVVYKDKHLKYLDYSKYKKTQQKAMQGKKEIWFQIKYTRKDLKIGVRLKTFIKYR